MNCRHQGLHLSSSAGEYAFSIAVGVIVERSETHQATNSCTLEEWRNTYQRVLECRKKRRNGCRTTETSALHVLGRVSTLLAIDSVGHFTEPELATRHPTR